MKEFDQTLLESEEMTGTTHGIVQSEGDIKCKGEKQEF